MPWPIGISVLPPMKRAQQKGDGAAIVSPGCECFPHRSRWPRADQFSTYFRPLDDIAGAAAGKESFPKRKFTIESLFVPSAATAPCMLICPWTSSM